MSELRIAGHEIGDRRCAGRNASDAEQASHDEGWSRGRITGTSKGLQLLRYPRSKPICATAARFPSTINLTCGRRS